MVCGSFSLFNRRNRATSFIPQEPTDELSSFYSYYSKHSIEGKNRSSGCILCDYLQLEKKKEIRIVYENDEYAVIVPYWAIWPYETILIGKSHIQNVTQLSSQQTQLLADAIKAITMKYDNLFETSFPYSMGIHQFISPSLDSKDLQKEFHSTHMHFHFYPPLLRSATIKKFMVGFELLAEPQRDITPEQSASNLRSISFLSHYLDTK